MSRLVGPDSTETYLRHAALDGGEVHIPGLVHAVLQQRGSHIFPKISKQGYFQARMSLIQNGLCLYPIALIYWLAAGP